MTQLAGLWQPVESRLRAAMLKLAGRRLLGAQSERPPLVVRWLPAAQVQSEEHPLPAGEPQLAA